MDFTPLAYRVLRWLGGRARLQDVCSKSWELAPAHEAVAPPAIFLPNQLEKVTGCQEDTDLPREMVRVQGGRQEHAATTAYRFRDVTLLGGALYHGRRKHRLLSHTQTLLAWGRPEELQEAVVACTLWGNCYFGHWVADDLPLTLAAQTLGPPLGAARPPYFHEPAYRTLLDLSTPTTEHARCRSLILLDDVGQNLFKRQRYERLRQRLRSAFRPAGYAGAWIRRGHSRGRRGLLNNAEVEARLEARGFAILDPQTMPVEELIPICLEASVIVGVEGSQLAHGLLAVRDGGALLALQPPDRFNNVYKDRADCLELAYGFVVGEAGAGGFSVNVEDLERTLDLLHANAPRRCRAVPASD